MSNQAKSLLILQRILGVKEDADYGPLTMAAMREWQAKHLPELPEVHRGYLTAHFWDKARELGLLTEDDEKDVF